MRVLYDASSFLGHSGIERYSRELLRGLMRQCPDVHAVLLATYRRQHDVERVFDDVRMPEVRPAMPHRLMFGPLFERLTHAMKLRAMATHSADCDLTHILSPVDDVRRLKRFVVSVHDLFPIDPAFSFDGLFERAFAKTIGTYMSASARILVQSTYVASTIIERFPAAASKIRCVPSAASDRFRTEEPNEEILEALEVTPDRPPIIFVGRVDGRKNLPGIVRAYASLPAHVREQHPLVLVISGTTEHIAAFRREHHADLERTNTQIRVAISTEALVQLMNVAQCMVFPSLAEGFGLPVLEAMQCGCAVITSNRSSLPEVAGDAALLVDPTSAEAIAHAMERICTDEHLHQSLVRAGLQRASLFTWDKAAQETAVVYREALEG